MGSFRLKELRIQRNISQKEIAATFGVVPRTIRKWESEDSDPTTKQLIALADYFDVSLDYLVGRSDNSKRP
ncbi:helix-turn-helix transcriptional regulator [Listeria monocytogenes]|nr:helix-turn-helix transcriptional regulator [Listeria monocytogenes]